MTQMEAMHPMPPNSPTAADRYERDPSFRTLVDVLYVNIEQGNFTPTELREAVILAATKYEYMHVRSYIFGPDGLFSVDPMRRR